MVFAMVLSKGLGMLRGVLLANHYGINMEANAFSTASRIPLAFFDMLFSAAILGCFIPVYNSFKSEQNTFDAESEKKADAFACVFLNFIFLLTGILTLVGILFAEPIIGLIAPNLDAETAALAASLLRIMFPMIIFTGAAYTLVGVLQSKNEFIVPSLISSISNAGVIFYFLFINDALGENAIHGLAFAYLIAWALQLLTLIIPLAKRKFRYYFCLDLKNPALRKALKMTPPIMIGSWLAPFGILSGTFFTPYLPIPGAITIFEYTNNIYVIIVGILTYGICNFTFPKLSRLNILGEHEAFSRTARSGLLSALYVVLPVMAAVIILSGEGTSILYQRGEFDASAAAYTARALKFISIGMPAFCIIEIVTRIMYSQTKVRIPMLAALCGITVNIISSALLIHVPALEVGAVALANALGQIAAAAVLIAALLRMSRGILDRSFLRELLKILAGTLFAAALMWLIYHMIGNQPFEAGIWKNLFTASVVVVPGIVVYLIATRLLRVKAIESL